MSVLSEFEQIRKQIGERRYKQICKFLEANPQYTLSDVYYRESVWKESIQWMLNNGMTPAVKKRDV